MSDLAHTTSLNHGDALELSDDSLVEIAAAEEELYKITGTELVRLAWHVGNRHTPCEINADHLLIQADPVIGHMLEHLGATVTPIMAPSHRRAGLTGMAAHIHMNMSPPP